MLCKYQNCTNPSCQFRHEDSNGNTIPPPALTARQAAKDKPVPVAVVPVHDANVSDNEDNDFEVVVSGRGLMDGPLEDKKMERPCRFGERCTRGESRDGSHEARTHAQPTASLVTHPRDPRPRALSWRSESLQTPAVCSGV